MAGPFQGFHGPGHQGILHRGDKGGTEILQRQFFPLLLGVVDGIEGGSLQSRKAHIQVRAGYFAPGQGISCGITAPSHFVQGFAAGIGHSQHPGHLVKALSRSVIPGGAHDSRIRIILYIQDQGIAAGNRKAHKGGLQLRKSDIIGSDMSPNMMNGDNGNIQGQGRSFGKIDAHQQRPDQARGIGDRNGIQIGLFNACFPDGLVCQAGNCLDVLSGGDLRHDAAIDGVHIDLAQHAGGEDLPSIPGNRHGSLITGAFDT